MKQGVVIASQSSIQIVYRASTTLLLIPNLYLSLLPNCPEDLIRQVFNTCDQLNCVLC
jgi:hypothetical protein